ncbi:hypothetical protein [Lacrimispora aerotolerans]|uniref:hypothetical protein n=1 Tax=Lacrimispora aerotolerans TaxID=36832 RepID=UPI00047E52FA|nr:hypothetical protein [Lacrimispora aerotolerans]
MKKLEDTIYTAIELSNNVANNLTFPQSIPNSPNPLLLSKWYAKEIEYCTAEIDKIEQSCGLNCSCSKGCSSCCRMLIGVTPVEALAFTNTLSNMEKTLLDRIKSTVAEQCIMLTNYGFPNNPLTVLNYLNQEKEMQKKYFDLHLECPFLSFNKECLIYSVRPIPCWTYRYYGNKKDCDMSTFPKDNILYSEFEKREIERLDIAKPRKNTTLQILQFALKSLLC